jgi:hypothetical protein
VLHQVPEGAVVPVNEHDKVLFDFHSISQLIIPGQQFCDRLMTACVKDYRVLGFPVCVEHQRYVRNQYIFNLCLVLHEDAEFSGHVTIVRKLATLFRNLEEQSMFLSMEEDREALDATAGHLSVDELDLGAGAGSSSGPERQTGHFLPGGKIYALCEMIFEDLNNYCECMIPIGEFFLMSHCTAQPIDF